MSATSPLYVTQPNGLPVATPMKIAKIALDNKDLSLIKDKDGKNLMVSDSTIDGVASGIYMTTRQIQTQSNISAIFVGGNIQVDMKMTGPTVAMDFITLGTYDLRLEVANPGVAAAQVLPIPYSIDHFELVIDGGVVLTYNSSRMLERRLLGTMARAEFNTKYSLMGYPTTTFDPTAAAAGITIPAGGRRIFHLPMHHVVGFLKQLPCVQAITSEVIFRFYFKQAANWCVSTSVQKSLICTDCRMVLGGHIMEGAAGAALIAASRASRVLVPAIYPQNRSNTFGAVAGNATIARYVLQQTGWITQLSVDLYSDTVVDPEDQIGLLSSFQKFSFYNGVGTLINNSCESSEALYNYNSTIYGDASPPAILPLTIADGTVAGYVAPIRYPDIGPNFPLCDKITDILSDEKRFGSYLFRGQEMVSIQAPAAGYTSLTAQFYFDQLATVQQDQEGKLQFMVAA